MRIWILFLISLVLSSCATMTPEQRTALQAKAERRIVCAKGDDCEAKWGRAITWVVRNSEWKIQTQTENIIQTFGPSTQFNSTANAFTVNKVPLGEGRYEITIGAGCGNLFGCIPDPMVQKASFNGFVLGEDQK